MTVTAWLVFAVAAFVALGWAIRDIRRARRQRFEETRTAFARALDEGWIK